MNSWIDCYLNSAYCTRANSLGCNHRTYYLFTMVVLTIVVTLILESFLFRMKSKQELINNKDPTTLITLKKEELDLPYRNREERVDDYQDLIQFEGKKRSNKEDLHSLLHPEIIKQWTEEAETLDTSRMPLLNTQLSREHAIDIFGSQNDVRMTLSRQLLSQRSVSSRSRNTLHRNVLNRSMSLA